MATIFQELLKFQGALCWAPTYIISFGPQSPRESGQCVHTHFTEEGICAQELK